MVISPIVCILYAKFLVTMREFLNVSPIRLYFFIIPTEHNSLYECVVFSGLCYLQNKCYHLKRECGAFCFKIV